MARGRDFGRPEAPRAAGRDLGDDAGLDEWFTRSVLPYETALTAFLRRNCRTQSDVADLRQEVYARVYEAARRERPRLPKAFIFTTARNLLIDRMRLARVVQIESMGDLTSLNVIGEEIPADRQLSARQDLDRLRLALEALPARCRQVLLLRKVEGLSQREVAAKMGITQATVEKQVAKAVRVLADRLGASLEPEQLSRGPGRRKRRWTLRS